MLYRMNDDEIEIGFFFLHATSEGSRCHPSNRSSWPSPYVLTANFIVFLKVAQGSEELQRSVDPHYDRINQD